MKEKKILRFDLTSDSIQVRNLLAQQFLNIRIKAISSAYPNLNNSHFTPKSIKDAYSSYFNKPVLCNYHKLNDTMGGHDSGGYEYDPEYDMVYEDFNDGDSEIPVGLIRESDSVDIVEENGLTWVYLECALWVSYNYKLVKKLLKSKGCKVSVEVEILKSFEDETGIEVIEEFSFLGVTLLDEMLQPAIPGAHMKITDLQKSESYSKFAKKLKFAYNKLENSEQIDDEHKDEITFDGEPSKEVESEQNL